MKHQITRTLSLSLAILTMLSAFSACGKKSPDATAATSSLSDANTASSDSFVVPEGYVVGEPHPLTNPDAGDIPSISYGGGRILYQDYLYYRVWFYDSPLSMELDLSALCYFKLSDLMTGDLTLNWSGEQQPAPQPSFVCNEPLCNHKSYTENNEILCPLYFGAPRDGNNQGVSFCLDYGESNGSMPVFYIYSNEPEYMVVDGQVIETESKDAAIYRYDSATGERTLLAEDLPEKYFFAQSGDYLYYSSHKKGLTVLDKTGKEKGSYQNFGTLFHILDVQDDMLYITDQYGNLYTSDRLLTKVEKIHTHEFDTTQVDSVFLGNVQGDENYIPPFGYTVSDGYLYYCDDFKMEREVQIGDSYTTREYSSSIYRLSLKNPDAEPEFLTDGVSGYDIIGVFNGKVYYHPYGRVVNGYYKLYMNCVDAATKEVTVVIDNGYDIPCVRGILPIVNEKFIVAYSFKMVRGGILIYDLETGDYCYLYREQFEKISG